MAVTTPDNIVTPDDGDGYDLVQDLAAMADSVQDAITDLRQTGSFRVANAAARDARFPSPAAGDRVWRTDLGYEEIYSGTQWEGVQVFTPSWSGFTPGSSVVSAWWQRNGEWIEGEVHVTLGSGWNFGASPRLTPPVPIVSPANSPVGEAIYVDTGTAYYPGHLVRSGSNIALLLVNTSTGQLNDVGNTAPFAWTAVGSPDEFHLRFRYRG